MSRRDSLKKLKNLIDPKHLIKKQTKEFVLKLELITETKMHLLINS